MSKAVLISINPEWCEMIARGTKTVEVRKTRPKIETPFKVYIYCTNGRKNHFWTGNAFDKDGNGRIIGEFVCDEICTYYPISNIDPINKPYGDDILESSCLSPEELNDYAFCRWGYGKLHGWHISNLKIYDTPKELSEFHNCYSCDYAGACNDKCWGGMKRSPQSWCYVEV